VPQDRAPLGAKECKANCWSMVKAKAVAGVAPTHQWVVWVCPPACVPAVAAVAASGRVEIGASVFSPDVTLLGLGCALTI
jgi:hypothetical protein